MSESLPKTQISPIFQNQGRRLDIQGMRAIAVLMVVAFHSGIPAPGGFLGVDVFFVISGFVIAAMLHREWHNTGQINYRNFYLRRFKRLTPALALMVAVTIIMSVALLSPLGIQQTAAETGIGALFLIANLVIARTSGGYFDVDAHTNPLLHTWSLSVEEQFYLVFPALIAISWTLARRRSLRFTPIVLISSLAVASFILACLSTTILTAVLPKALDILGPHVRWITNLLGFYSPLTRSWEFAAGVLLALNIPKVSVHSRATAFGMGIIGAAMLAASLWLLPSTSTFPGVWTLVPVIGTLLLIAAGTGPGSTFTALLSSASMARIGDWSYSIYLWHWPFIVGAERLWPGNQPAIIASAALSSIPAIASYHWVETPIRQWDGFSGRRAARLIAITLLVPLLFCSSALYGARRGYWSSGVQQMQAAVMKPHATAGCAVDPAATGASQPCLFGAGAGGRPIFLVGDSTAEHFTEAAIGAGRILERPVDVLPIHGCEFKEIFRDSGDRIKDLQCRERYERAMDWLMRQPSGTVVISDLNSDYGSVPAGSRPGNFSTDRDQAIQVRNQGLTSTIEMLQKAGHSVVVVQSAPYFKDFAPLRCSLRELEANSCRADISRSQMDAEQQAERASLQTIAAQSGAGLWDPREFFCTDNVCTTQIDGMNLYRDSVHITASASPLLADSLAVAIRNAPAPIPGRR